MNTRDAYTSNKIRLSRFGLVSGLSERVMGARDVYASKSNVDHNPWKTRQNRFSHMVHYYYIPFLTSK